MDEIYIVQYYLDGWHDYKKYNTFDEALQYIEKRIQLYEEWRIIDETGREAASFKLKIRKEYDLHIKRYEEAEYVIRNVRKDKPK